MKVLAIQAELQQKAFDKCIDGAAFKGDGKYHEIMNMYKTSQLYGKNCDVEAFMHCLLEYFKKRKDDE